MKHLWIGVAFVALFVFAVQAQADSVVVVPPGNEFVEGDSNNAFPFDTGSMRYQQVIEASLFGGASGVIDKMLFRVEGGYGSFSGNFTLDVRMSHTSTTAASMSTTFANNIGGDETVVLSGAVTLSGTGGAGPNPFDVVLDLNDSFAYDGVSNLLFDIRLSSGQSTVQFDSVRTALGASSIQRVWGGLNSASGSQGGDRGLVTAFEFAAVPEPSSILLCLGGILGAAVLRRRR